MHMGIILETRIVCTECLNTWPWLDPYSKYIVVVYGLCPTHQLISGKGIIGRPFEPRPSSPTSDQIQPASSEHTLASR